MNDKAWRKSSYSGAQNNCVQVAFSFGSGRAHLGDTKAPTGTDFSVPTSALVGLISMIRSGAVDHLN